MDFDVLNDDRLASVEFTEDLVRLHFDGADLELYGWPDLADADGVSIAFGQPGYRDALCSVIGTSVLKAELDEERSMTIEFENGTVVALSLREEDREGNEAGELTTNSGERLNF